MNAELVRRLEVSLANDRRAELFEAGLPTAIGNVVAATMHEAGKFAGLHSTMTVEGSLQWYDDPYAYDQAACRSGDHRLATAARDYQNPTPLLQGSAGRDEQDLADDGPIRGPRNRCSQKHQQAQLTRSDPGNRA